MATILLPSSKTKDATAKDPSLRAKIGPFINKLATMSGSSGLHLEHIHRTKDRRVRTARVTEFYRAVLFELNAGDEVVYVVHGVWPHDEANRIAESITVGVNPYNGATEVTRIQDCVQQDARAVEQARRTARAALAAANKRVQNLLKKADAELGEVNESLLQQDEEKALYAAAQGLQPKIAAAVAEGNFQTALSELASVKPQVDAFFDGVMVMAEDPAVKQNRLNLLNRLAEQMNAVADIALLGE